jgi:hypothetical protein
MCVGGNPSSSGSKSPISRQVRIHDNNTNPPAEKWEGSFCGNCMLRGVGSLRFTIAGKHVYTGKDHDQQRNPDRQFGEPVQGLP